MEQIRLLQFSFYFFNQLMDVVSTILQVHKNLFSYLFLPVLFLLFPGKLNFLYCGD